MKCIFIYNPKSGRGKILKKLDYIVKTLYKKFDVVDVYESQSANDVMAKVKESCLIYDAIIFSGGDGTFNNITCGISSESVRPVLGYIPSGTANDIARNLSIPRNIKGALKCIVNGGVFYHDVGKINDSYFTYVATIGACTGTSYKTKHQAKKILGRLAYIKDGVDEFFNTPVSKVKYISDTKKIEMTSPLLLVMNSKSVGGISFNKYGHLNDGLFDIILVKDDKSKGRFNIIKTFVHGLLGGRWRKSAILLRESKFKIEVSDDITWCIDGEKGPSGSVEIENLKGHLQIYVPLKKLKKKLKKEKKNNV